MHSLKWYTSTKFLFLQVLKILRLSFSSESIGINMLYVILITLFINFSFSLIPCLMLMLLKGGFLINSDKLLYRDKTYPMVSDVSLFDLCYLKT